MFGKPKGRVLIIAGSDSGGGAGIQGDIKTVTCLGGYAATAITALTAQNTLGVFGILEVPLDFLHRQITLVMDDIGADVIKTGMLHSEGVIRTVAETLKLYMPIPLVVDPVMVAKGGAKLLQPEAIAALTSTLLPMATLVTPNIPEAELLTGLTIRTQEDMRNAARALMNTGARAVLIKGGHLPGDTVYNVLVDENEETTLSTPRITTLHTHGTGCTLASAIATGLAEGMPLKDAVIRAELYVAKAIKNAPGLGRGHGPIGHNYRVGT